MAELKLLLEELKPHQEKLANHPIYKSLTSIDDVKLFMENHVFAVWDFMSLLKALQLKLTSVCVPWLPPLAPSTSRLINEIVLGEESDLNDQGIPKSHFEMYLDAMKEVGACTHQIELFIMKIQSGNNINEAIQNIEIAEETKSFVKKTFNVIHSNKAHLIAASFTFGREDVIPEMFLALLNN